MKKIEVTICMLMVFTMTLMAQNPFVTKADIIEDFNISPNGKMMVYREFPAEGLPNISMKNMKKGKITLISCMSHPDSLISALELFSGVDFLSDNVVVFCKDNYMVSFNINKNTSKQLFQLSDEMIVLHFIKTSNDGKGIYFLGGEKIYYALMDKGIVAQTDKTDKTIMSLTIDKRNRAFYTTTARKVYCFDGLNKEKDITYEISKFVAEPYLIEANRDENSFIVAGKDAVFKIDLSTGKSVKLMDNNPKNRLYIMRLSPDGKALYYNTIYEKRKIRKLELADNQSNNSNVQDNVVLDISNK